MDNFLFRSSLPYRVEFDNLKIFVSNRDYKLLFVGIIPKDSIDFLTPKINSFCAYSVNPFSLFSGCVYLYDDVPMTDKNDVLFDYKSLNDYFTRLTSLLEFCSGLTPDVDSYPYLCK